MTKDGEQNATVMRPWKKAVFLSLAGLFFLHGVLGIVLPGLPATPFLLLTSYFLVRSSPRLNTALLRSPFFGPILAQWQAERTVRPDIKAKAIALVIFTVALTVYLSGYSPIATGVILVLAAIGVTVILKLKSNPS